MQVYTIFNGNVEEGKQNVRAKCPTCGVINILRALEINDSIVYVCLEDELTTVVPQLFLGYDSGCQECGGEIPHALYGRNPLTYPAVCKLDLLKITKKELIVLSNGVVLDARKLRWLFSRIIVCRLAVGCGDVTQGFYSAGVVANDLRFVKDPDRVYEYHNPLEDGYPRASFVSVFDMINNGELANACADIHINREINSGETVIWPTEGRYSHREVFGCDGLSLEPLKLRILGKLYKLCFDSDVCRFDHVSEQEVRLRAATQFPFCVHTIADSVAAKVVRRADESMRVRMREMIEGNEKGVFEYSGVYLFKTEDILKAQTESMYTVAVPNKNGKIFALTEREAAGHIANSFNVAMSMLPTSDGSANGWEFCSDRKVTFGRDEKHPGTPMTARRLERSTTAVNETAPLVRVKTPEEDGLETVNGVVIPGQKAPYQTHVPPVDRSTRFWLFVLKWLTVAWTKLSRFSYLVAIFVVVSSWVSVAYFMIADAKRQRYEESTFHAWRHPGMDLTLPATYAGVACCSVLSEHHGEECSWYRVVPAKMLLLLAGVLPPGAQQCPVQLVKESAIAAYDVGNSRLLNSFLNSMDMTGTLYEAVWKMCLAGVANATYGEDVGCSDCRFKTATGADITYILFVHIILMLCVLYAVENLPRYIGKKALELCQRITVKRAEAVVYGPSAKHDSHGRARFAKHFNMLEASHTYVRICAGFISLEVSVGDLFKHIVEIYYQPEVLTNLGVTQEDVVRVLSQVIQLMRDNKMSHLARLDSMKGKLYETLLRGKYDFLIVQEPIVTKLVNDMLEDPEAFFNRIPVVADRVVPTFEGKRKGGKVQSLARSLKRSKNCTSFLGSGEVKDCDDIKQMYGRAAYDTVCEKMSGRDRELMRDYLEDLFSVGPGGDAGVMEDEALTYKQLKFLASKGDPDNVDIEAVAQILAEMRMIAEANRETSAEWQEMALSDGKEEWDIEQFYDRYFESFQKVTLSLTAQMRAKQPDEVAQSVGKDGKKDGAVQLGKSKDAVFRLAVETAQKQGSEHAVVYVAPVNGELKVVAQDGAKTVAGTTEEHMSHISAPKHIDPVEISQAAPDTKRAAKKAKGKIAVQSFGGTHPPTKEVQKKVGAAKADKPPLVPVVQESLSKRPIVNTSTCPVPVLIEVKKVEFLTEGLTKTIEEMRQGVIVGFSYLAKVPTAQVMTVRHRGEQDLGHLLTYDEGKGESVEVKIKFIIDRRGECVEFTLKRVTMAFEIDDMENFDQAVVLTGAVVPVGDVSVESIVPKIQSVVKSPSDFLGNNIISSTDVTTTFLQVAGNGAENVVHSFGTIQAFDCCTFTHDASTTRLEGGKSGRGTSGSPCCKIRGQKCFFVALHCSSQGGLNRAVKACSAAFVQQALSRHFRRGENSPTSS